MGSTSTCRRSSSESSRTRWQSSCARRRVDATLTTDGPRTELDKTFRPAELEPPIYAAWEASGAFAADPGSGARPYAIMMPPPNVTGSLHMGHALTFTLQDIL